jgi:hypothetical protein
MLVAHTVDGDWSLRLPVAQDGDLVFDCYHIIFFGCVSTTISSLYNEVVKPEFGLVVTDPVHAVLMVLYVKCIVAITTGLLIVADDAEVNAARNITSSTLSDIVDVPGGISCPRSKTQDRPYEASASWGYVSGFRSRVRSGGEDVTPQRVVSVA